MTVKPGGWTILIGYRRMLIAVSSGATVPRTQTTMSLTVEWLGHCAFRLTGNGGPSILIDPFDETIGLHVPQFDCDILLISHSHYDSAARHLVPPGYELVSTKGTSLVKGVAINSLPWWHDERLGKDFGSVLIFHFELDGFKIAYLSHIGCIPKQWILEKLEGLDICFVPVGGTFALGADGAKYLSNQLSPRLIIPMHFKLRYLNFTLHPLSDFTRLMPESLEVRDWKVELARDNLPKTPAVLLMRHWPGVTPS